MESTMLWIEHTCYIGTGDTRWPRGVMVIVPVVGVTTVLATVILTVAVVVSELNVAEAEDGVTVMPFGGVNVMACAPKAILVSVYDAF